MDGRIIFFLPAKIPLDQETSSYVQQEKEAGSQMKIFLPHSYYCIFFNIKPKIVLKEALSLLM